MPQFASKSFKKLEKSQKKAILSLKEPESKYGVDGTTSIAEEFMFYIAKKKHIWNLGTMFSILVYQVECPLELHCPFRPFGSNTNSGNHASIRLC